MVDNLLQAAMTAAWKTDPVFVVLAKSLYGEDAEFEDITSEVFKSDPDQSAVHIPGNSKKKIKIMDNRALVETKEELGKILATSVSKGLITNEVAMEVAKDWAEFDSKRKANAAMYRDARKHPRKYQKDPEVKQRVNRYMGGVLGADVGISGGLMGIVTASSEHEMAMFHDAKSQNAMRNAQHHANLARDAAEMHHGEEVIRQHMEAGKKAYDLGIIHNKSAVRAAKTSLRAGRAGVAGAGLGALSVGYAVHQRRKLDERRRDIAQVRVKTAKRLTTGQSAAIGGVVGAGAGLTYGGPKVGAVAGGVAAGAVAASTHYHRKYLKEHIKNSHNGSYHKCTTCAQRRASSVIKILRGPVIKDWAKFDARRAGAAGLVAGVGTGAVLEHKSQKVKTNVLADVAEGKTGTAKGTARALEDLGHAATLSSRGGKAALVGVAAAAVGEAVHHHNKVNKAGTEVSKLSGYDYEDKHLGYTWTNRVGYHPERGAVWQHNPTKGKPFYTAEKDGKETPFDGEYKKFAPDHRPNVNRNINDPSPTTRAFAPKRDQEGKFAKSEVTWEGEFSKVDDDKRQVFGWASVTEIDGKPVVDLQGDYIHPTEMERAAYDYVLKSRKGGDMHRRVDENGNLIEKADAPLHVSDMIESMVFTPEKVAKLGLPEGSLPTGWWVGFKVNDEPTWDLVKSGERTGFSIHGMGARMEKRLEEIDPRSELIGKAFEESGSYDEFQANLETISEVTGDEFYKHIHHGINNPQGINQYSHSTSVQGATHTTRDTAVGAGLGSAIGSNIGSLAGAMSGKGGEVSRGSQAAGGLIGAAVGAGIGHHISMPDRPPIVELHLGPRVVAPSKPKKVKKNVEKAVSTSNRTGSLGHRQNYYQQQALQEATAQLAPQVAQHIQMMQQQKWQQAQMEQMQLQQQAGGQKPQDWRTQQQAQMPTPMGPYDMQDPSNNGVTPGQQTGPMAPIS